MSLLLAACSGGAEKRTGDAAVWPDAESDGSSSVDHPVDLAVDSAGDSVGDLGGSPNPAGVACAADLDCASGHCADGVCCDTACADACTTCAAPGTVGTCVTAAAGTNPRAACKDQGVTSCGTTGQCDGAGACQKYSAGTICQQSGCKDAALMTAGRCDGAGACIGPGSTSCAPFQCDSAGQCRTTCMTDVDCTSSNTCNQGSCGRKPVGATCGNRAECNSGICAQGVCCSTDCSGACKSCALPSSAGTCTNVPAGQDPLMQCADEGASTCGGDGTCDGAGSCRKYAPGTVCGVDTCMGGVQSLAGRCGGPSGACQAATQIPCSPYACGATACLPKCATNADCAPGFLCTNTICTKKPNGTACTAGSECLSGQCYQGVCCNVACSGTCMSCSLAGTGGTCTSVPAGQAPVPASQCAAGSKATCGNDGTCDGKGACRSWSAGTICASPGCAGSTLTTARTCNGAGVCRAATSSACDPFVCGASGACRTDCATNMDCASPNACVSGSCGKLPPGATCASAGQCNSGFCEQGICCATACTGTCKSCAVSGSEGTCTNVAAGVAPTPAAQCANSAPSSCGSDGTCDGQGACHLYSSGTTCVGASCTGMTYALPRVCDGDGACAAATTSSCNAYQCDATANACKTSCSGDADCAPSYFCNNKVCSKKPLGTACGAAAECNSGFCAQGVCCASDCTGTCQSCALVGKAGTCSPIATGMAPTPASQCADAGRSTCGMNGLCDGKGACQLYANGSVCVEAGCVGSTFTQVRTCDGAGVCKAVTASLCDPYTCDTTKKACRSTPCLSSADCASPNQCVNGSCGSKPNGSSCAADGECNSSHCQQGTCCSTVCSGLCVSCANASGVCANAMVGTDPLEQCAPAAASTCGFDGACDGSGGCRRYASGTQCVAPICTGSTLTAAATCNGGTCGTPASSSCSPYNCGSGACKTSCSGNADCIDSTYVCTGSKCTLATNLQVQIWAGIVGPAVWISQHFQILNKSPAGTPAIPLSELTVRYWYTNDTSAAAGSLNCNYAVLNCSNISYGSSSFVVVNPARTKADRYLQFGFTSGAGSLAANASTGEIQLQWAKSDWSSFDQSNDYSYNGAASYATTMAVTVYRNGTLIYGSEPM